MLNPGHLISYDEWVHSPIERDSEVSLASGMALQCDIIPTPIPAGTALNCEDSIVLADEALRAEIASRHPDCRPDPAQPGSHAAPAWTHVAAGDTPALAGQRLCPARLAFSRDVCTLPS